MTNATPRSLAGARSGSRTRWLPLAGLAALAVIPLASGILRLVQLAGGPQLMPVDARFAVSALPLVAHIAGSLLFALLGAVQFVPRLRQHRNSWHRRAGRVVAAVGLVAATSALWITVFYPQREGTGDLLFLLRLVFASGMVACLGLGIAAIRRRDMSAHRAWMIRAYAIGMAAGTQAFTEGLSNATFGSSILMDDAAKGMGWLINLAVAEWVIRRAPRRRRLSSATPRVGGT